MAISTRGLRPLVINGVSWAWRMYDPWDGNELMVVRSDRRTIAWLFWGANVTARIERRGDDTSGVYVVPAEVVDGEWGPRLAARFAAWADSDAPKQPVAPALAPPTPSEWRPLRDEGRYWFSPEGHDEGEERVRAVIEERLQQPVIASMLPALEAELGPTLTRSFALECAEALVARGVLDESWLLPETRSIAMDRFDPLEERAWGIRSLRALWALAKAPRAVIEAERLAREFEQRVRAIRVDRSEAGLAALSWVVVEHPRERRFPIQYPGEGEPQFEPWHRWFRELLELPTEALRALVEWPPPLRPIDGYRADASAQTPLLELCRQRCEERRAWRALCESDARVRPHEKLEANGFLPSLAGAPLRSLPALFDPSADVSRAGFALWSELPWRMVLIATVQR